MDKYPSISPYAYCAWNPIIATDPNGLDSIHTPNGMANAGEGYRTTPDGLYLYGEGLRIKKWNSGLETGGTVGECGGYEDCSQSDLSGFQVSLAAGGALKSLDEVIGVGSDGYCYYGRTKYGQLIPGTARNRVRPLSKSIPGKFVRHGANVLSVLWSADEVGTNYKENGPDSPEFYSSVGGLVGSTASIGISTSAGALAGSVFGGLGAIPGAIAGFVAGTASSVALDWGGRKAGEAVYKKTH